MHFQLECRGLVLFVCVILFEWNTMEKITWIASALIVGLTYAYLGIHGKSFDPSEYFKLLKNRITKRVYLEFMVDLSELKELEELKSEFDKITPPNTSL